jgi:ArsR family transcriptional regulator
MDSYEQAAERFKALGHPSRLRILDMLRADEVCVCHIEAALGKRQAYVSQQLMALREAGLVVARREGGRIYYRLADEGLHALLDLILPLPAAQTLEGCACPSCAIPSR